MKHLIDLTPPGRWLADVLHPALVATALFLIPIFSQTPANLLLLKAGKAEILMVVYGLLLVSIIIKPEGANRRHAIGAALAVLCFVGRGGGFLELVLGEDKLTHLWAAATERLPMATAQILWHRDRKLYHNDLS